MKKFITFIAKQELQSGNYKAADNIRLSNDLTLSYPVSVLINAFAVADEEIELLVIHDSENKLYEENFEILKKELEMIKQSKGIDFPVRITELEISSKLFASDNLRTFSGILNKINDGDDLYVDISYGTKPFPVVEFMAVNAAFTMKKDVTIGMITYGECNFQKKPHELFIYDETNLFYMMQCSGILADYCESESEKSGSDTELKPANVISKLVGEEKNGRQR